jgi:hypothetical protein
MAFLQKPRNFFQLIKTNFYLRKHTPLPSTLKLLQDLYPNVNWNRVDFYEGLPWFTPLVAPYVTCQALPRFYSLSGFRIYIRKFDESRAQCLADIVHEAFHVMQAMRFGRGYGVGFFRGWMLYYIAVFARHGYRQNPFEIPAYDQEYRFLGYCEKKGLHGITPEVVPSAFSDIHKEAALVFPHFNFKYSENYLLLAGSFIFCLVITPVKPVMDGIVVVVRLFVKRR